MLLNPAMNKVKVKAIWDSQFSKVVTLEEALDDLEDGTATTLYTDTILLLKKKQSVKTRVLERDKYICYFCGNYGDTLEHLHPSSKGGKTTMENCVCACKTCNSHKGDMTEGEYWQSLKNKYIWKKKEKQLLKEIFSSDIKTASYEIKHKEICKCGNLITRDCFYEDLCLDCENKVFGKR